MLGVTLTDSLDNNKNKVGGNKNNKNYKKNRKKRKIKRTKDVRRVMHNSSLRGSSKGLVPRHVLYHSRTSSQCPSALTTRTMQVNGDVLSRKWRQVQGEIFNANYSHCWRTNIDGRFSALDLPAPTFNPFILRE